MPLHCEDAIRTTLNGYDRRELEQKMDTWNIKQFCVLDDKIVCIRSEDTFSLAVHITIENCA